MSDNIETPNQNPQTQDPPPSATTMAETEQTPPQSETTSTATSASISAAAADKLVNGSFSIWPPSERTRDAVRNRLIETLSSASILSKRYGTVPHEEAVEAAKIMEEEAFVEAGKAATADDDGIEILQVYSKGISKRMLDKVKARSSESAAPSAAETTPAVNDEPNKPEEEDAGSTAPPQSEKTESIADDE